MKNKTKWNGIARVASIKAALTFFVLFCNVVYVSFLLIAPHVHRYGHTTVGIVAYF